MELIIQASMPKGCSFIWMFSLWFSNGGRFLPLSSLWFHLYWKAVLKPTLSECGLDAALLCLASWIDLAEPQIFPLLWPYPVVAFLWRTPIGSCTKRTSYSAGFCLLHSVKTTEGAKIKLIFLHRKGLGQFWKPRGWARWCTGSLEKWGREKGCCP